MNNRYFFFVLFLTSVFGGISAQNPNFIKQTDTLQDGSVLITMLQQDSTFIKRYLATAPVDTSLLFKNIMTSLPASDQSNSDYNVENNNLFGDKTSALPWDICYNPDLNKYYIYNYRKIMVYNCNGVGSFEDPVVISGYDEINTNFLEPNTTNKMVYYNNYLYCASNEGKIVVINCSNNQIASEYSGPQMSSLYKSDLRQVSGDIFWYYSAITNGGYQSCVKKITGTVLSASLNMSNTIINDWCFDDKTNGSVYLATNNGIKKYSTSLTWVASSMYSSDVFNLTYFDNGSIERIIAFQSEERLHAYLPNLNLDHDFQTSMISYFNMIFEENSEIIHFTGINAGNRGFYGRIYYNAFTGEFTEDVNHVFIDTPPMALAVNGTDGWISDKNKITKIDQGFVPTTYSFDGYCTNLHIYVYGTSILNIFGSAPLSGDFFVFDINMDRTTIETGGIINGVCRKLDRTYYSVNKNNGKGYVMCKFNNTVISIAPENDFFDPISVFCFKEEEQTDVIVAYKSKDNQGVFWLKFAKIDFNTLDFRVLENLEYTWVNRIIHNTIKTFDKKIFFAQFNPYACPNLPVVHFNYSNPNSFTYNGEPITNCPDIKYNPVDDEGYVLDRCYSHIKVYDPDDLGNMVEEIDVISNLIEYYPYSLCFSANRDKLYVSGQQYYTYNKDCIHLLTYDMNTNSFISNEDYQLNNEQILVTDLTLGSDNYVYGFSKKYWYKLNQTTNSVAEYQYDNSLILESYDISYDPDKNLFYIYSSNNSENEVKTLILDAANNSFLTPIIAETPYLTNTIEEYNLSYLDNNMSVIHSGNYSSCIASKITCPYTRQMNTPWQWLSFPRLQRTGNNSVVATTALEDLNPIPYNLNFYSNEDGNEQFIARITGNWSSTPFNEVISTKGYKLNILDQGIYDHTMYGTDLDLNTAIQLYVEQNNNPENWIGYFMPMALEPEDAFVGVWDYLTKIQTQDWTMRKTSTGEWMRPSNVTPLEYGDAVIVEVSNNCTLYWNQNAEPTGEQEERGGTEFFSYLEYSDYTPWYIQTDSLQGVQEIALLADDSCIGATVMLPTDTLIEVNAYTQAVAPGTAIEIATWDGLKSTAVDKHDFLVENLMTRARESRQVFTGEGQPYYYITFGDEGNKAQSASVRPAHILKISPNPCTEYTAIGFSVEHDAMVEIIVTDINGKQVSSLTNGYYPKGAYQSVWNPGDSPDNNVKNGIYLVQMKVNGKMVQNEKVVVIR